MRAHSALVRAMPKGREVLAELLSEDFEGQINTHRYETDGFLDALDRICEHYPDYGAFANRKVYEPSVSQAGVLVVRYYITIKGGGAFCEDRVQLDDSGKICWYHHRDLTIAPVVLG